MANLLALPREIRDMIWQYTILSIGPCARGSQIHTELTDTGTEIPAILKVNKQIRDEAVGYWISARCFSVVSLLPQKPGRDHANNYGRLVASLPEKEKCNMGEARVEIYHRGGNFLIIIPSFDRGISVCKDKRYLWPAGCVQIMAHSLPDLFYRVPNEGEDTEENSVVLDELARDLNLANSATNMWREDEFMLERDQPFISVETTDVPQLVECAYAIARTSSMVDPQSVKATTIQPCPKDPAGSRGSSFKSVIRAIQSKFR
ncbi:MAG: hypothetical protein M1821_007654 [Bathelium mastoideum]|nr:MAG: hypothetical protein M1821_007654 [Bathelium mastoideum]